jgi:aminotransferase
MSQAPPPDGGTKARYTLLELAETIPDVISLGRGDPDLDTPRPIIDRAMELARKEPTALDVRGHRGLRETIASRYRVEKSLDFDPETEILVTNGVQEGLFLTMLALVNPGEKVLIADPRYTSYDQAVAAAGGVMVEVPTTRSGHDDFTMDPADIAVRADGAKALVLVNPNNPTSAFVSDERVRATAQVAREKGLVVLSDEIYENLVFDGNRVLSVASCEGMRDYTVTLAGFSKTYAMTGFRAGYLLGPKAFIDAATRLKQAITGPSPLFSQLAALAALEQPPDVPAALLGTFEARREIMMQGLDSLGIPYGRPGGGFYIWADISRFGLPAADLCRRLLIEGKVLIFPGSSFGERWSGYARISLLQPEDRLREAVRRMSGWFQSLSA